MSARRRLQKKLESRKVEAAQIVNSLSQPKPMGGPAGQPASQGNLNGFADPDDFYDMKSLKEQVQNLPTPPSKRQAKRRLRQIKQSMAQEQARRVQMILHCDWSCNRMTQAGKQTWLHFVGRHSVFRYHAYDASLSGSNATCALFVATFASAKQKREELTNFVALNNFDALRCALIALPLWGIGRVRVALSHATDIPGGLEEVANMNEKLDMVHDTIAEPKGEHDLVTSNKIAVMMIQSIVYNLEMRHPPIFRDYLNGKTAPPDAEEFTAIFRPHVALIQAPVAKEVPPVPPPAP